MVNYHKLYKVANNFDILFVEDDTDFIETSSEIFSNIFHSITTARNGEEGLEKYLDYYKKEKKYYDMVISDFHMPKMNGIDLSKAIYKINPIQSIVIISAFNDADNLISFINLGIDKFLLKPFNVETMVNVLYESSLDIIQKRTPKKDSLIYFSKDIVWNNETQLLSHNDTIIHLPKKEQQFLQLLTANYPKITTYREVFNHLWGDEYYSTNQNTLKSIISRLRTKLPENTIQNISKTGYRLQY
jgi:DNA-binding response OmpR family regulator